MTPVPEDVLKLAALCTKLTVELGAFSAEPAIARHINKLLIADRASRAPQGQAGVKALEWKSNGGHDPNSLWTGELACRVYYGIEPEERVFRLERGQFLSEAGRDDMGLFPTVSAAQEEAQKDWGLLIAPALSHPDPVAPQETRGPTPDGFVVVPKMALSRVMLAFGELRSNDGVCGPEESIPFAGSATLGDIWTVREALRDTFAIPQPSPGEAQPQQSGEAVPVAWQHKLTGIVRDTKPGLAPDDYIPLYPAPPSAREAIEALEKARDVFAMIECQNIGQSHLTNPQELIEWQKHIAGRGFNATSVALAALKGEKE